MEVNMKKLSQSLIALLVLATACAPKEPATLKESATLTVMTHDSFEVSEQVIQAFEQAEGVQVDILKSGDAGAALNKAILTRDAPLADILFGVDNTFLSRALEEDIFESYLSPLLSQIPTKFQLDLTSNLLPVDYGDVCINYDKAYFAEAGLSVPASLEDLLRPEYDGLLVTSNPATSSPGLAFMLATVAHFGDPGYLDYWAGLRDNGLVVVGDWETAYYINFSASSGKGPQPMVVSYGSSPPAEVIFAETELTEAPTASIVGPGTCFRQIEFVGILKGTRNHALAEKFIDFMLSVPFQEDVPLQMFVFPVNQQATLPDPFVKYAQVPEQPAYLPPAEIAQNRDRWIAEWSQTVLR
jgi:thiamine transport system substrate-binding protein